ncbi:bifunctional phosphoglucose/phosphomannose isomerase [Candidatus Falkowbacteria bacterium]|nr:bifunctional phosphoglucose/phosphomannose isomerase [Candidatus Falkowbacteria bacterium]
MFNENIDKQNLREIISDLPKQFAQALETVSVKISTETKKIIFCGLGGSAFPAELFQTFLDATKTKFNAALYVSRDYCLPHFVDNSWCGFFSSYSGNTEETLSALENAEKIGLSSIVIFAHGGKLKQIAAEKGYLLVEIPDFKQPRMSYGYFVGALIKIFQNSNLLTADFDEITQSVQQCLAEQPAIEAQARKLALSIKDKISVVYSSALWKYIAMVWKINFNENAKTPCFWNFFPELNHNEMVGFANLVDNYKAVILKDPADHERNKKRMDIFTKIFDEKLKAEIIEMPAGAPFYKMIWTLWLGLWTSYHLALLNNVDPTPVDLVEEFKLRMSE